MPPATVRGRMVGTRVPHACGSSARRRGPGDGQTVFPVDLLELSDPNRTAMKRSSPQSCRSSSTVSVAPANTSSARVISSPRASRVAVRFAASNSIGTIHVTTTNRVSFRIRSSTGPSAGSPTVDRRRRRTIGWSTPRQRWTRHDTRARQPAAHSATTPTRYVPGGPTETSHGRSCTTCPGTSGRSGEKYSNRCWTRGPEHGYPMGCTPGRNRGAPLRAPRAGAAGVARGTRAVPEGHLDTAHHADDGEGGDLVRASGVHPARRAAGSKMPGRPRG